MDLVVDVPDLAPTGSRARALRRRAAIRLPQAASAASRSLAAGTLTSMLMLASFALLFQPRVFPPAPRSSAKDQAASRRASSHPGDSDQQVIGGGSGGASHARCGGRGQPEAALRRSRHRPTARGCIAGVRKEWPSTRPSRADASSPIDSTTTSTRRAARSVFRPACLWPTLSLSAIGRSPPARRHR